MREFLYAVGMIFFVGYLIVMLKAKRLVVSRLNQLLAPDYYFFVASVGGSGYYLAKAVLFKRLKDGKPLPDDARLNELIRTYNILWLMPLAVVAVAGPIYMLIHQP
jgi:hypothetical protein